MSILYDYIVTVYFAFDKVLLKNFTTTTIPLDAARSVTKVCKLKRFSIRELPVRQNCLPQRSLLASIITVVSLCGQYLISVSYLQGNEKYQTTGLDFLSLLNIRL